LDAEIAAGGIAAGPVGFSEVDVSEHDVPGAGVAPLKRADEENFFGESEEAVRMCGGGISGAPHEHFRSARFSVEADIVRGGLLIGRCNSLGSAIKGADLRDFFGGSTRGEHCGDVATVIGGNKHLPLGEFDSETAGDLFNGGEGGGAVIVGVGVVINVGSAKRIGPGEFNPDDFGARMLPADACERDEDRRFEVCPCGSPRLGRGEDSFTTRLDEVADFKRLEVVEGEDPHAVLLRDR